MATTSYDDVKFRLGDIEANIGTGSENVISNAISGAYAEVLRFTGSSTDDLVQYAVATRASITVAESFLGRDNQSVSNERIALIENLRNTYNAQLSALGWDSRFAKVNP